MKWFETCDNMVYAEMDKIQAQLFIVVKVLEFTTNQLRAADKR